MKIKLFLFLILFPLSQLCLFGQTLVKDQPETGNKINCASFRVHLKPGYSFIPEGSESMEASISSECGPFFIVDTRDILDVVSFQISGAGLSGSYTSDDEYTFSPVVAYGTTDTIEISLVNSDTSLITIISIELNDQLKIVSSSVSVEENGIVRIYSANNYLTNNSGGDLNFRIAQLYADLIYKGCIANDVGNNWISAKYFDEEGNLISSSISFYNLLGNPIQNQSRALSANNVISSQIVYDAFGRSVLTTLPAPTYQNIICFNDEFIRDPDNFSYDFTDFDVPNYTSNSSSISLGEIDSPISVKQSTKGSVGWYYSDNNDEEIHVATTDFPYSRVEYDPNNPGMIKRTTSPHDELIMGSGREVKSFSMPAAGELNYVFGFASGWTIQYDFDYFEDISDWDDFEIYNKDLVFKYNVFKQINVDSDGKESISFKDEEGKLIATCYSGLGDDEENEADLAVTSYIKGQDFSERYIDIHLPEGVETSIAIGNEFFNNDPYYLFDILDLDKNEYVYEDVDGQSIILSPGFYRIINKSIAYYNNTTNFKDDIPIRYDLNYYDFTLYYYDKAGRLISVISPKGIDQEYDPNVQTSVDVERLQFQQNGVNMPYLGSTTTNFEVELPLTTTPINSQQFSMALVYLTEHNSSPLIQINNYNLVSSTSRTTGQDNGLSSGTQSFKYNDSSNPLPEIFVPACAYGDFGIDKTFLINEYNLDPYDDEAIEEYVYFLGAIGCYNRNKVFSFFYFDSGNGGRYCVSCAKGIKTDIDRKYEIYVDIITNNSTLREDVKLIAEHHTSTTYNADFWTFNISPNQLFSDSEGELIDIPASITTNEVKGIVTNIKEFTQMYNATYDSWYYEQTYDYLYIEELDLNVAAITNEFPGGYPSHKPSEINQYNSISQVLKTISADKGVVDYVYNEEGLLRFSRNDQQKADGKFSYVNYDEFGRPIQSGEYDQSNMTTGPDIVFFQNHYNQYANVGYAVSATTPTILNNSDYYDLTHAGKTADINFTQYDSPDPDFNTTTGLSVNDYKQQVSFGNVSKTWIKPTENASTIPVTTWYSYDDQGRVMWEVQKITDLGGTLDNQIKTIDYVYNNAGDLVKTIYQKRNANEYFAHQYTYDIDKRLANVKTSIDGGVSWQQQANYYYYQHGPIKRVELANQLQGIDYVYNTLGWLKSINSPNLGASSGFTDPGTDSPSSNSFAVDVFGMTIDYFSGDYTRTGVNTASGVAQNESYAGNIKSTRWNTVGLPSPTSGNHWMYSYQYNKKGFIKDATFGQFNPSTVAFAANSNDYKVNNFAYDNNGNILSLTRNAYNNPPNSSYYMDELVYSYKPNTNQLVHVANNAYNSTAWPSSVPVAAQAFDVGDDNTWEYEYDAIGQLLNNHKDEHYFKYNVSGLVTHVYKDVARTELIAKYDYDDKGYRYKKTLYDNNGTTVIAKTYYIHDASGNVQYIYNEDVVTPANSSSEYPIYGASRLGVYYSGLATIYELSDHLGNVRATINRNKLGNNAVVEQYADYYPFGEKLPGRNSSTSLLYKYGYQGQFAEEDAETGYNQFEARLYDGRLGRWMTVDPANQFHSPYLAMGNDPLNYTDPTGEFAWAPVIIGAALGGLSGWQNGQALGAKGWSMAGYIAGGALVGAASGHVGSTIATSGMLMANTVSIAGASLVNSLGTSMYTGGQTDVSMSLGVASYNFDKNEWGSFGSSNSILENIGYGLGAFANVSDGWAALKGAYNSKTTLELQTAGHSQTYNPETGETFSWGAMKENGEYYDRTIENALKKLNPVTDYVSPKVGSLYRTVDINKINITGYNNYISTLPKQGQFYRLASFVPIKGMHCTIAASRALLAGGVFNIPILRMPWLLDLQMRIRNYTYLSGNLTQTP